jgi:hypothetical protein
MGAKAHHFLARARLPTRRFALDIDQLEQAHGLKKIEAVALSEEDFL